MCRSEGIGTEGKMDRRLVRAEVSLSVRFRLQQGNGPGSDRMKDKERSSV